jgi:hypothetical protein
VSVPVSAGTLAPPPSETPLPAPISLQLERWLAGDGEHTLAGLMEVFAEKSFALLFILLLGVSALPLPTGGATHVFDVIAIVVAAQLVVGRDRIWIPKRWRRLPLAGRRQQRFVNALLKLIRLLERLSRPRLTFLFDHRISNSVFGLLVIVLTVAAFLAPPFSGLDTLPALAVVLISLGVLLEDALVVAIGIAVGAAGVVLEIVLGKAAVAGISRLFQG